MTKQIDELMALAIELRNVSNEQALGKALALKAALEAALKDCRNATLEEAAKLCDEMQPVPASEPRHCAQDIRSMKS
jgi:hypothetical protein